MEASNCTRSDLIKDNNGISYFDSFKPGSVSLICPEKKDIEIKGSVDTETYNFY